MQAVLTQASGPKRRRIRDVSRLAPKQQRLEVKWQRRSVESVQAVIIHFRYWSKSSWLNAFRVVDLFFSPQPPERLLSITRDRLSLVEQVMPELRSLQNTLASKPKVKFFERASGIEEIFEESLQADSEILGYTNLSLLIKASRAFFDATPASE